MTRFICLQILALFERALLHRISRFSLPQLAESY
jgi:hypothetical protein